MFMDQILISALKNGVSNFIFLKDVWVENDNVRNEIEKVIKNKIKTGSDQTKIHE